MTKKRRIFNLSMFLGLLGGAVFGSLLLTQFVLANPNYQSLIQDFGPISLVLISFIAGLNVLVPIPAATFVPVFTAGGISLPTIVLFLVIGAMAANLLSYVAGRYGSKVAKAHYPEAQQKLARLYRDKEHWVPYFIFGFAAFIPIPDEVYLIPLALIGIKFKCIFMPLFVGTIVYQTMAVYGFANIFKLLL